MKRLRMLGTDGDAMTNSLEPSAVGEVFDLSDLGVATVRPIRADDFLCHIRFTWRETGR